MKSNEIIYQNIGKQKYFLVTNILLCSMCSLLGVAIPLIPGYLIDSLISKEDVCNIIILLLIYVVLAVLSTILDYIKNIEIIRSENKIYKKILSDIVEYLTDVEVKVLKKYRPAYLTQRIDNDISSILKYIIGYGSTFIITSLSLIISLYILFHINIFFAIIALISIPIYVLLSCVLKNPIYNINYKLRDEQDLFISNINNEIELLEEIKLNNLRKTAISKLESYFKPFYKATLEAYKLGYLIKSLDGFFSLFIQVLFFITGIKLVYLGLISIGEFSISITYYSTVLQSVKYYFEFYKCTKTVKVSFIRLDELLNLDRTQNGTEMIDKLEKINVRNFKYTYDGKELAYKNKEFLRGRIYILKGSNGSGKTTFLSLLSGLNKVNNNIIMFNDIDINCLNQKMVREELISYVKQEPQFWDLPVETNFEIYLQQKVSLQEVVEKIVKVGLQNFMGEEFMKGTLWNKNINELSVGQRKKIMICIQAIRDNTILIFDEPNAALDDIAIMELKKWIKKIKKHHIILVVSHDSVYNDIESSILLEI